MPNTGAQVICPAWFFKQFMKSIHCKGHSCIYVLEVLVFCSFVLDAEKRNKHLIIACQLFWPECKLTAICFQEIRRLRSAFVLGWSVLRRCSCSLIPGVSGVCFDPQARNAEGIFVEELDLVITDPACFVPDPLVKLILRNEVSLADTRTRQKTSSAVWARRAWRGKEAYTLLRRYSGKWNRQKKTTWHVASWHNVFTQPQV